MYSTESASCQTGKEKKSKNGRPVACQQDGMHGEDVAGWAQTAETRLRKDLGSHLTSSR